MGFLPPRIPASAPWLSLPIHRLLLGLFVMATLFARSSGAEVAVGDAVPLLSMPLEGGAAFVLAEEARSGPVLVEFVSPQCKPCLDSRPALESLLLGLRTRDPVALVSVALGAGRDLELLPPPNRALGEKRVMASDEVAHAYGIFGTPVFLLVDRRGTVVWKHVGRLTAAVANSTLHAVLEDGRLAYVPGQSSPGSVEASQKTR